MIGGIDNGAMPRRIYDVFCYCKCPNPGNGW